MELRRIAVHDGVAGAPGRTPGEPDVPTGPLHGLRVVDLTQVLSGPYCTMLLADLGAEVLKVEPPGGDVARSWGPSVGESTSYGGYFASVNRNKRSVCLDLKTEQGRADLLRLLATADVLVENFRIGVMERLRLSYEELHVMFPRLVYATIRGFGDPRTGASPYAAWPALDIVAQAMGGVMGITGADAGHPVKVGPAVGDIFPGALGAVGILAAVRHAQATGTGQLVDVAMVDAVISLTERIVYQHSITGVSPSPQGNTHPLLCPYGVVRTATGLVAIAAPSDHHWAELASILGHPDLATDERFSTNSARLVHSDHVYRLIEAWSSRHSTADVVAALAGRIPCGPVNTAADIAADPHTRARDMIVEVPHPDGATIGIAGSAIKMTETPVSGFVRAPMLGEHTDEVLAQPSVAVPMTPRASANADADLAIPTW